MGLYVLKYPYRRMLLPVAALLGGVHPDVLSYLATGVSAATAACYVFAAERPWLLACAIVLTLLRMTLNTLDGVLAIRRGRLTLKGEVVNALPDRYSVILVVAGIALSGLCRPVLGLLGLASMLLVSYVGVLGKALGASWQHQGPLGKVERLICIMALTLVQLVLLRGGRTGWTILGWPLTPLELAMIAFTALGQVTVFNRTRGILRQVAKLQWQRDGSAPGRALVVYDSSTGNTAKVAGAIAEALGAELSCVDEVRDVSGHDLIVIGSPTISSRPTDKVMRFLRGHPELGSYAAFVTYGAPVIGAGKARKALRCFEQAIGRRPLARFRCKGRHALVNTYRRHPDEDDLLSAFLFGVGLAKAQENRP
ncbi:MAG TPA: flavodoxin family protein [Phycisphaerae bacterium]|nr:flavodoxin family protein [Phycisphaerae bacterium]